MADERFDINEVYESATWTIVFENAVGMQEKFYDLVKKAIEKTDFPNIKVSEVEAKTGGIFFNSEVTKMVKMEPKESQFKKFRIYFRAVIFGNTAVISRYECMKAGVFDVLSGKGGGDIYAQVQKKCKNLLEWEQFNAIDQIANIVYYKALYELDPDYKEKLSLMLKGK